jgi:phosphoribosylaminoimidazolecarboxamide formyltransferase/IMP cyclohydrolase
VSGDDELRVARALLTVSDPRGLVDLARGLEALSVELWATSGTRRTLADGGVRAKSTEEITGIGDWFGGRIKTLHPALLGGILAPRTPEGMRELSERSLKPIDLVVVNFYPFADRLRRSPGATNLEESIDVGGVTLARAAAKNHGAVAVASDPSEYGEVLAELRQREGRLAGRTRRTLAAAAFRRCSEYDALIGANLAGEPPSTTAFPETLTLRRDPLTLRYGENPHQPAATYRVVRSGGATMEPLPLEVVKGDRLSYTNLLDIDTALRTVSEFPVAAAAVVKHATPCGVATGETLEEAVANAVATDPVARYGCVLGTNRPFDAAAASALKGIFVDLVVAPEFSPDAREALGRRAKVKVVRAPIPRDDDPFWEVHSAAGRVLLQRGDRRQLTPGEFRPVAGPTPDDAVAATLDFAWRVVRHAKSNAVVLAADSATVGIGAGQTTRVKAVELAIEVAGTRAKGSVLASDAFFPFADGIEAAGKAGIRAILQPGGSVRDPEVIAAAERFGIAMYFTGWRVFRH